jgi:hypothetical protein
LQSEKSFFGVDPKELEFTTDGDYSVPSLLVNIKSNIYENDGKSKEGIFR